jgi:hypothetical protein
MRWRSFKAIRILFLMAEAHDWKITPVLQRYVTDMFQGLPDTKVIEDTHQKLRDLSRENKNFVSSRVKRMFSCMQSGKLEARHSKVLVPVDRDLVTQSWRELRNVKIRQITQTRGVKLKNHQLQMIMHPKTAASTTPEGLFNVAAATEWVFHYWKLSDDIQLEQSWQSVLLIRFDIVRHIPSARVMMVTAPAPYAFQCWTMNAQPGQIPTWTLQAPPWAEK